MDFILFKIWLNLSTLVFPKLIFLSYVFVFLKAPLKPFSSNQCKHFKSCCDGEYVYRRPGGEVAKAFGVICFLTFDLCVVTLRLALSDLQHFISTSWQNIQDSYFASIFLAKASIFLHSKGLNFLHKENVTPFLVRVCADFAVKEKYIQHFRRGLQNVLVGPKSKMDRPDWADVIALDCRKLFHFLNSSSQPPCLNLVWIQYLSSMAVTVTWPKFVKFQILPGPT